VGTHGLLDGSRETWFRFCDDRVRLGCMKSWRAQLGLDSPNGIVYELGWTAPFILGIAW
jgi:hypothetical protein